MHKDPTFKGRSLAFSSDLSIAAPIKRGLVPALDAVSYKTRAQRLLDTLHAGRMRNHEYAYARLFSDAVERVQVIQSVRVAVLEPEDKLLLTVSFDGNWDAYIRTLWVKVGGLLDVIFCNTEGYVEARLHSCEAWGQWVREHQVQTHFFYGSADGSATDLLYLRRQERLRQDRAAADPEPPPGMLPRAEQRAREMLDMTDATVAEDQWPRNELMVATMLRQGLQSLAGLYRMADWYVPGTADGDVLHRAAHELLQDFVDAWDRKLYAMALQDVMTRLAERFARQLAWLFDRRPPQRVATAGGMALDAGDLSDVQGGIVRGYEGLTHAALLMFSFADAEAGARFLRAVRPMLHAASDGEQVGPLEIRRTLFLTLNGLRRLGVDDAAVEQLPEAFVQGMAARAGLLGDRHDNHPERWTPPRRHLAAASADERIDLAAIHAVIYLRVNGPETSHGLWDLQPGHPLMPEVQALQTRVPGAELLAVEPLRRLYRDPEGRAGVHEHFGFADGNGQPGLGAQSPPDYPGNNLPYGEILLGHPDRGDVKLDGVHLPPGREILAWLRNASFLVLRKYRQWPDRFEAMLRRAAADTGLDAEAVAAELMGRDRQGRPLVSPASNTNRFTYLADPAGRRCPLHAHVRRANPRRLAQDMLAGEREPRILRRSVSYGPRTQEAGPEAERGLMFMAFNADIAEQFEVVQRWLTGGHATDTGSAISCPIVGVPEPGRPRRFEFDLAGRLARITLDGEGPMLGDAESLVRLEWGAYWLAPSLSGIDQLAAMAEARRAAPSLPYSADRGLELIGSLQQQGAGKSEWKAVLEDAESQRRFDAASVWAAVRTQHGGALRCPMGVLVGSQAAVAELLRDTSQHTTVTGYAERTVDSMGPIFLGLDDRHGTAYQEESGPVRKAIGEIKPDEAYATAADAVTQRLVWLVAGSRKQSELSGDERFELVFDDREIVDEVLARLCESWFGIDDQGSPPCFRRSGARWDGPTDQPSYPGHFMAPSRYIFQPAPESLVTDVGQRHGAELRQAMIRFLAARSPQPLVDVKTGQGAHVGQAVVDHPLSRTQPDFAARTMVGTIMGFVPTMDGALRAVLGEWRRTGEWARLRGLYAGARWARRDAEDKLGVAMDRALQLRCVPDVVWRRATKDFEVAGVAVKPGQTLVLGLGSAAQEALSHGLPDRSRAMFGGTRDAAGVPTHACPGYEAARASMLGALAILVTTPWPLHELPGTSSWRVVGTTAGNTGVSVRRSLSTRARRGRVLCWGDSWVDYRAGGAIGPRIDLLEVLHRDYPHYTMEGRNGFASYANWLTIRKMASERQRFLVELQARLDIEDAPDIILLSGGGNDSTGDTLKALLLPYKDDDGPYLRPEETRAHIDELIGHYRAILKDIRRISTAAGTQNVQVLLHGYDHPFPNWVISAWLKRAFVDVGYSESDPAHWVRAAKAMRELIEGLNDAQKALADSFPGFAHHVNLQGTIAEHWQPDARLGWVNELHPTAAGFKRLAAKVDVALQSALEAARRVSPQSRA